MAAKRKQSTSEEKAELRGLLSVMRSDSPVAMSPEQGERLGRLGSKYKFDSEFRDDLYISGLPTVYRKRK